MSSSFYTRKGSGAPWEDQVGYSRAVKAGNIIEVAGTTATGINAYEQTKAIILKAKDALQPLGASLDHVVRTRMYCTDISEWEAIGKAHGEFFKDIKPVTTMVEVAALIDKELLVEIEFTAILPHETN
ncbi:RidA family protein [Aquimarina sp. ERC-38]|uniref:RidA family protein n=1 Tax=Aquimarina sp. ERC-38 TaxID=2949996 RepID=UPI00224556CC|nr:RidA family protein [Aquimarina sp. ERC-38]UZO79492.1 RidA family protein [Aquimarina sp. ERC-38]